MFGFIEPDFDQHDWWLIEPEDVDEYLVIVDQVRGSEPELYQQGVLEESMP